jgi:endonuclease/exonuclease/phosphatase family metal-dependent hydrolase
MLDAGCRMYHNDTSTTKGRRTRALGAIAVVMLVMLMTARANAELPHEIRVITYNIHHGEGTDKKFDLPRIAKVLLAEKPDIVALQEVDQGTRRASGVDQPAELERLTGMRVVFGHNIDYDGGGYGTAVLSRLPIRSYESVKLKSFYESTPEHAEQRGVQMIELGDKNEPGLLFLCTHLDFRPPDDERMNSALTINDLIRKRANMPAIIAGDFNATPDSRPIHEFAKQWKIAAPKLRADGTAEKNARPIFTYPSDKPDKWIDYVMCRPANRWDVIEVRVLDEPVASDHRPLLAVLRRAK